MAHYNLYDSLNINSTTSSSDILSLLDSRIMEGKLDNLGGVEEIELAKQILGNEQKRAQYDSRLADPASPDITVGEIRELAAITSGAQSSVKDNSEAGSQNGLQGENQRQSRRDARASGFNSPIHPERIAGVKSTFNSATAGATDRARDVQAEYKKSSRTAIIITAVSAFAAGGIIFGLVGSMLGGGSGSIGSSGIDYNGAEKFANSFLELRSADETREWIIQNTDASTRNSMLDKLRISDNGSYTGMDAYFGANDLVSGRPVSMTEFFRSINDSAEAYVNDYAESGSGDDAASKLMADSPLSYMFGHTDIDPEDQYFTIPIIGDKNFGEGSLSVVKDDDRWVLNEFSRG